LELDLKYMKVSRL